MEGAEADVPRKMISNKGLPFREERDVICTASCAVCSLMNWQSTPQSDSYCTLISPLTEPRDYSTGTARWHMICNPFL